MGVDQLHTKMVKKAADRRLIKFFFLAIAQNNSLLFSYKVSDGIKSLSHETAFTDLIIFFRFKLIMSIACLWPLKLCFKIFSKRSHRICSDFAIIVATMGEIKASNLNDFWKKKNSWQREIQGQVKNVIVLLCCLGNFDVNKTFIKKFSSLYSTAVVTFSRYLFWCRRSKRSRLPKKSSLATLTKVDTF